MRLSTWCLRLGLMRRTTAYPLTWLIAMSLWEKSQPTRPCQCPRCGKSLTCRSDPPSVLSLYTPTRHDFSPFLRRTIALQLGTLS